MMGRRSAERNPSQETYYLPAVMLLYARWGGGFFVRAVLFRQLSPRSYVGTGFFNGLHDEAEIDGVIP